MKNTFLFVLGLSLCCVTGCSYSSTGGNSPRPSSAPPAASGDVLEHCVDKHTQQVLDFYQSHREDVVSKFFPSQKISQIVDVQGNHVTVNSQQWQYDFVCTSTPVKPAAASSSH